MTDIKIYNDFLFSIFGIGENGGRYFNISNIVLFQFLSRSSFEMLRKTYS